MFFILPSYNISVYFLRLITVLNIFLGDSRLPMRKNCSGLVLRSQLRLWQVDVPRKAGPFFCTLSKELKPQNIS